MCKHATVTNEMLSVLEEHFEFNEAERAEARLMLLQLLEKEELFDEPAQT